MFGTTLTFAASSLFALSLAAPVRLNALTPSALVARDSYVMFGGDGTINAGWPKKSQWLPFEKAWAANLKVIQNACVNNGWGKNNDDTETQAIKDSIIAESASSGIPKEFILAIMVQESKGCVRVPTTAWDFANPGLMQSSGQASCNPSGTPISPCPASTIRAMIHDGTAGEGLRTTLQNSLAAFNTADDSKWYKAARRYNAGPGMDTNNLGVGPTKCYASDIANRLVQPFGDSSCNVNVIATLSRAQGQITTGDQQNEEPEDSTPTTQQPAPAPATPAPATPTAAYPQQPAPAAPTPATPQPATPQPQTSKPATQQPEAPKPETPKPETPKPETPKPETPKPATPQPEKESPSKDEPKQPTGPADSSVPIIDGTSKTCAKYYVPVKGDICDTAPIPFAALRQLNPQLNAQCTNLWAGYRYCITA